MSRRIVLMTLLVLSAALPAMARQAAAEESPAAPDPMEGVKIRELLVNGSIDGTNIDFVIEFDVETTQTARRFPLIRGDAVLQSIEVTGADHRLGYDPQQRAYVLSMNKKGARHIRAAFSVRPTPLENGVWREARFDVPASQLRRLSVSADRTDLQVLFPDAMRIDRAVTDEQLTLSAILGPGKPFVVRWKPQVQALDAELVATIEANVVAHVLSGSMRQDALYLVDISQGKLSELCFRVPADLSITQVRGPFIRDWTVTGSGDERTLTVALNREQTGRYVLQLVAESVLPAFPAEMNLPVIHPIDIHTRGNIMVGTDSAIALRVIRSTGLSQIDNSGFPRVLLSRDLPRPVPGAKAFSYAFASMPFQMRLSLADIVPSYDVTQRLVVDMKEDDLQINAELSLEVRDAPVRTLTIDTPRGFNVADVSGSLLTDYRVFAGAGDDGPKRVEIQFAEPVIGNTMIALRLEMGRTPLGVDQVVKPLVVRGAKTQRGYAVVTAEQGVRLELAEASDEDKLKSVHTGSVPMRVPDAQYAYRFRDTDWSLKLRATRQTAGIVAEAFHLVTLGEDIAYGSFVVNYFITGSPVDELAFTVPEGLRGLEFVGKDIARKKREGNVWTVKLNRKVIGDYNIALTFNQRYDETPITIGALRCNGVERQSGYVLVTSHLNLDLSLAEPQANDSLLQIEREEVPANYRLLSHAPILRCFKYATRPQGTSLTVRPYDRVELLDVVVEMMDIRTDLAVRDSGETESITRIVYNVKNTSRQFLKLIKPTESRVLRVNRITLDQQGRVIERQRIAAAADEANPDLLMIPLMRNQNPNEPIMIELELSQRNGTLGIGGKLQLQTPYTHVPATFADWRITVPDNWSIQPTGGNMVSTSGPAGRLDMAWIGARVAEAWSTAWNGVLDSAASIAYSLTWLATILLVAVFRRRYLADVLIVGVLLAVAGLGVYAASELQTTGSVAYGTIALEGVPTSTQAAFTQVAKAGGEGAQQDGPLSVVLRVVPKWREHATALRSIFIPVGVVVSLVLAALITRANRQRQSWLLGVLRTGLLAAALIGLMIFLAQFPLASMWLALLLTAVIPVVLLGAYLWRAVVWVMIHAPSGSAVAVAVLLSISITGCVESAWVDPVQEQPVIERVEAHLTADRDSLTVQMDLVIWADKPMMIPVLDQRAVLLSTDEPTSNIRIERMSNAYVVRVLKKGKYEIQTKWITPLPVAGDDRLRQLVLPLPVALSNRVTLVVPDTNIELTSPTAVRLDTREVSEKTVATASFGPTNHAAFAWRPRERQREQEDTVFYSQAVSLYRFDTGLIEGRHRVDLQIAQGVVQDLRVTLPTGITVTSVQAPHLGAWRYEPDSRELVVKLNRPVAGDYRMTFVTQVSLDALPHTATVGGLGIADATRSQASVGLVSSNTVYIEVDRRDGRINVDDFARTTADLLKAFGQNPAVRHAFRADDPIETIAVKMNAVKPELRALENASFTVSDDRLTYNGQITIDIAKAGKFSTELRIPESFDIDTLTADHVSHWDEAVVDGYRSVIVHFRHKLTGRVTLNLTLSRSEAELPRQIEVPRVQVVGAIKHTGRVVLSAVRGVSLAVLERHGVSELRAADLGIRQPGTLVYKILQPDWRLVLESEVVAPLITAEYLHVADVGEGVVRHTHHLRYKLQNAGTKFFELKLPTGATGLQILGPNIARRQQVAPGHWRVELTGKWFDQPYPLTLRYESRHERASETVTLEPVIALNTDRQRGHVVINKSDRYELAPGHMGDTLRPAEPRNIPGYFLAGDLSGAAYCYVSPTPRYDLSMRVRRLESAEQLEASVEFAEVQTVITENGQSINRVRMRLRVGSKRLLEARLPDGARIWSLSVNHQSVAPSHRSEAGKAVLLIPLAQAALGELPVDIELIYIHNTGVNRWAATQSLQGPSFDLPLRDIRWLIFVPDGYAYSGFDGTLSVNRETVDQTILAQYDVRRYHQNVLRANRRDLDLAQQQQQLGNRFALEGRQYEARNLLEQALNNSTMRQDLNEDIRVDLHNLRTQQAMVGLVGTRDRLRYGKESAGQPGDNDLGDNYSQQQVDRVFGTLSQADNDNLKIITRRLVEVQDQAVGQWAQLSIDVPLRGRVIEFQRPLQVEENAPMRVRFNASAPLPVGVSRDMPWLGGLYVGLAFVIVFGGFIWRHLTAWRDGLTPRHNGSSDRVNAETDEEDIDQD